MNWDKYLSNFIFNQLMRIGIVILIVILLLFSIQVNALEETENCNLFCKIKTFLVKIFVPYESTPETEEDKIIVEKEIPDESQEWEANIHEEIIDEQIEVVVIESNEIEYYEGKQDTIEEQIKIIDEKTVDPKLSDINVADPGCKIETSAESVIGDKGVDYSVTFNEDLKHTSITIYCDQFERNGIGSDEGYLSTVPNSLLYDENVPCDWGKVTTPTVYFIMIVGEDDQDLCVKSVTVLPDNNEADFGDNGCFSDTAIQGMIDECGGSGYHSTLDANLCPTIYCGLESSQISHCPSEGLLEMAEENCESKGENYLAVRYSEEVEWQDWPCAQVRCSLCPSGEEKIVLEQDCASMGENYEPQEFVDFEKSGCSYILCTEIAE